MASGKTSGLKYKIIFLSLALVVIYLTYKTTLGSNVHINADTYYFYVAEKSSPEAVADTLKKRGFLKSRLSFKAMAYFLDLENVKPGMYELKKGWNNYKLIGHFKKHHPKTTVFITLPALQNRNSVITTLCRGTKIHPDDVWALLNDRKFVKELGGFTQRIRLWNFFTPQLSDIPKLFRRGVVKKIVSGIPSFLEQQTNGQGS